MYVLSTLVDGLISHQILDTEEALLSWQVQNEISIFFFTKQNHYIVFIVNSTIHGVGDPACSVLKYQL
jgi:hypothetical protein